MLFSESMKKVMLAGIGAVAATAERSREIVDELVEKGELTVEQGKVLNEELKHKVKETIKDTAPAAGTKDPRKTEDILSQMEHCSPEELSAIQDKLNQLRDGSASSIEITS